MGGVGGEGVAARTRSPSSCVNWKARPAAVPEKAGHVFSHRCASRHDRAEPQVRPPGPQCPQPRPGSTPSPAVLRGAPEDAEEGACFFLPELAFRLFEKEEA